MAGRLLLASIGCTCLTQVRGLSSNFRNILSTPVQLRGLGEVLARYDTVLLDQFGVLHDGQSPLPYALNTVNEILARRKKIIILSNSSMRSNTALRRLHRMGFDSLEHVLTSGEMAWQYLHTHYKGSKCCWITWNNYKKDKYLDGLDMTVTSILEADVLILHGTQVLIEDTHTDGKSIDYISTGILDPILQYTLSVACNRGIPVICSNLDLTAMMATGEIGYMPGGILAEYEKIGGKSSVSFGKPKVEYFNTALTMTGFKPKNILEANQQRIRTLHIGDSIHHDIAGADASGIDSVLITRHGVHKHTLHTLESDVVDENQPPLLMRVADLCDGLSMPRPTFILEHLWS